MKTIEIEIAVANYFGYRQNVIVPNISWGMFLHECDVLILTKSGYLKEVEIKVSKYDLIKDLKKKHKHNHKDIKELYFAIPEKLLPEIGYIPERAGILIAKHYTNSYERYLCTLERPALIDRNAKPIPEKDRINMMRLGTMRIWGMKKKLCNYLFDKNLNIMEKA